MIKKKILAQLPWFVNAFSSRLASLLPHLFHGKSAKHYRFRRTCGCCPDGLFSRWGVPKIR